MINTNNKNISLYSSVKKAKIPPIAKEVIKALRQSNETGSANSQAAQEAFSEEENTKVYIALQSKGLNNLRSEIISTCEFIPVSTEYTSEDSARLSRQIGENNEVSVTNIARLIELHRQIREYVTSAGEKLLSEIYPEVYNSSFLLWADNNIKSIFKNRLEGEDFTTQGNDLINSTINKIIEYLIDLGDEQSNIVSNYSNNYFFLGLVEYFLYDNIIELVIKYIGEVESIDKLMTDYWGIDKFKSLLEFNTQDSLSLTSDNRLSSLFSNPDFNLNDSNFLKNTLGLVRDASNSDTDVLLNTAGQLASILTLRDSSAVLSTLRNASDDSLKIQPGKIKIGIQSDLANTIAQLKYISLPGCLALLPDGTLSEITERLGGDVTVDRSEFITKNNFFKIFKNIKNANGTSRDITNGIQELLVAMCFDINSFYIKTIGGEKHLDYSISDSLNSYPGLENTKYFVETDDFEVLQNLPRGQNIYYDFIEKTLGIPYSALRIDEYTKNVSNAIIDRNPVIPKHNSTNSNQTGFGSFIKNISGYRSDITEGGAVNYKPLESFDLEKTEEGTLTGPNYFLKSKIENLNFDLNDNNSELQTDELSSYSNDVYKDLSNKFIEDLLTLYPDEIITRRYSNLADIAGLSGESTLRASDTTGQGRSNNTETIQKPPTEKGSHKLTPLGTGGPKSLLHTTISNLEKDLIQIINGSDKLLTLLAIFLKSGTDNQLIRMFCSVLWGSVMASEYLAIPGGTVAAGQQGSVADIASEFLEGGFTSQKANDMGPILEYYIESVFNDFIKQLGLSRLTSGQNAKGKFRISGVEYTLRLGDDTNLFNRECVANKIQGVKEINATAKNTSIDGEKIKLSIEASEIDNVFDKELGGGGRRNRVKDVVNKGEEREYGLYRLFRNSFRFAAIPAPTKQYADVAPELEFLEPDFNMTYNKYPFIDTIKSLSLGGTGTYRIFYKGYESPTGSFYKDDHSPARFGGIIDLCLQHRMLISFMWIRELLKRTLRIQAKTDSNGVLTLIAFKDQIKGVVDGLRQSRGLEPSYALESTSYDEAKRKANLWSKYTIDKMDVRQKSIRSAGLLYSAHASSLKNIGEKVKNILLGLDSSGAINNSRALAVKVLKDNNVYSDTISLSSSFTPVQIYLNRNNIFKSRIREGSLLPNNSKHHLNKVNFVTNVLSLPGYGLLRSEKRGNKSILNVGITNSMMAYLQREKFQETGDLNFLNSPYICISVYKKDHFNPSYNFYPKNYVFDTSANILDDALDLALPSNHIRNYSYNNNIDTLLKSVDIARLSFDRDGNIITSTSRGYPDGVFSREVLINHVFDYCFKSYFSLTNSLSFNEDTFLLSKDIIDMSSIQTTNFLGEELNKEYRRVLGEIRKRYPNANLDSQLLSEVYRMQNIVKQSLPFSFVNRYKKLILPKSFDKVYSILVNEKDFVLDTDKTIYVEEPKFYLNSKISRPGIDIAFSNSRGVNEVKNYTKSLDENYPEVYNYHVVVSLLPIEFMPGADLKLSDTNI